MKEKTSVIIDKFLSEYDQVELEFVKADGTVRHMLCTTKIKTIPTEFHPKGENKNVTPPHVRNVFDIEKQAWRRFCVDKVLWIRGVPCQEEK